MNIDIDQHQDYVLLHLKGSIDLDHVEKLNDTMLKIIHSGQKNFIINMKEVNFISMVGIGSLVALYQKVQEVQGFIGFIHVSEIIHEILKVSQFDQLFSFYQDEEQAHKALHKKCDQDYLDLQESIQKRFPHLQNAVHFEVSRSILGSIMHIFHQPLPEKLGLFLPNKELFALGTLLNVQMVHMQQAHAPIKIVVEVDWVASKDHDPEHFPGMGVHLITADSKAFELTKQWLQLEE